MHIQSHAEKTVGKKANVFALYKIQEAAIGSQVCHSFSLPVATRSLSWLEYDPSALKWTFCTPKHHGPYNESEYSVCGSAEMTDIILVRGDNMAVLGLLLHGSCVCCDR